MTNDSLPQTSTQATTKATAQAPTEGPTSTRSWQDRASGELATWGATYNPTSPAAARMWRAHREQIEPLIAATNPAGVIEARRVASAVLELLAWAMPRYNDFDQCLSEETLHQFRVENPTGLGDGALANIRGRVRRVLRVRTYEVALEVTAAATTTHAENPSQAADTPADGAGAEGVTAPDRQAETYDQDTWTRLVEAARVDEVLADVLELPWIQPSVAEWKHACEVARSLGIELRQQHLRNTIYLLALSNPQRSLGDVLLATGMSRNAATDAAALLPAVTPDAYAALLRGPGPDGQCTQPDHRHRAESLDRPGEVQQPAPSGGPAPMPLDPVSTQPGKQRKPSVRQARLAAAAARAEHQQRAASLPESIRSYIQHSYEPLEPALAHWQAVKGAVEATLAASAVRGDDSMRKHVTHLAYFFAWANSSGLPLAPSTLTRAQVTHYEVEVLSAGSRTTQQTRRSRLLQMADQIHPDQAPIKGAPIPHRKIAAPYSADEMASIRRVAQVQPTPLLKRQVCLLVGLGAGAGIDSTDLKRLRRCDVTDHGPEGGLEVTVTNLRRTKDNSQTKHHRTVWVLREYEDLVRIGLEGLTRSQLLLGRDAERANVAASVYDRAAFHGDVAAMSQGRLRSTWLATHLTRTTPLNVLLTAAGLSTARTIVELLPYLPQDPTDDSNRLR